MKHASAVAQTPSPICPGILIIIYKCVFVLDRQEDNSQNALRFNDEGGSGNASRERPQCSCPNKELRIMQPGESSQLGRHVALAIGCHNVSPRGNCFSSDQSNSYLTGAYILFLSNRVMAQNVPHTDIRQPCWRILYSIAIQATRRKKNL